MGWHRGGVRRHGRTVAQTASFLCRDVDEVRAKMKELGLQPGKRRVVL
jgi:hypothetical protein